MTSKAMLKFWSVLHIKNISYSFTKNTLYKHRFATKLFLINTQSLQGKQENLSPVPIDAAALICTFSFFLKFS